MSDLASYQAPHGLVNPRHKNIHVLVAKTYRVDVALTAAAAKSVSVPTGASKVVFFSRGYEFYANYEGTAQVPSGDVTNGTAPDWCPKVRDLADVAQISLIAPVSCRVQLAFFKE